MKVEENKGGKHICCTRKFFCLTTPPLLPDHTLLDKLHPLDDINDLCIINGHCLHIISLINMCAEEVIPALRAGTNSLKFFDLFFLIALGDSCLSN